ncbi:MAG: Ig-like domain-containing protein, partial [Lachnospiraceae bacterium]|nr:Ig-like domain-containing protein [Lachnospiraceae bacterium]
KSMNIAVAYIPSGANDDKELTRWYNSDDGVLLVRHGQGANGAKNVLTAKNVGESVITAIDPQNGVSASLTVLVSEPVKKLGFSDKNMSMRIISANQSSPALEGIDNYQRSVVVSPAKALWKSSNEKVAKVDRSGRVTAVSTGRAAISATYGGKTAKYTINIY